MSTPTFETDHGMHLYQVVGRHKPTERDPTPKIFRMKVFAVNEVVAKSKFWYFIKRFKRVKRINGEIMACNEVSVAKCFSCGCSHTDENTFC